MHNRLDVMGLSRLWVARLAFVRPLASFWNLLAHRLAWPYVELLIRLWIAKLFFLFGVRELMLWTTTLQIVVEQNPFPALAPAVAGGLCTRADLLCGAVVWV